MFDHMKVGIHKKHEGQPITVNSILSNLRSAKPPASSLRASLPPPPEDQTARPGIYQAVNVAMESLRDRGFLLTELMTLKDPNHLEINGILSIFLKLQIWNQHHYDDILLCLSWFEDINLAVTYPEHALALKDHCSPVWEVATLGDVFISCF